MLFLLLCACCLCAAWILWLRKKSESEPPVLSRALPIVGHSFELLGGAVNNYKTIIKYADECTQKGGIASAYFGFIQIYYITDPEALLTISNTCIDKPHHYKFAQLFLGDGLITSSGSIWKKHRRLLNPAFSQLVLNSFIEIFNKQARVLVDQLTLHLGQPFDYEGTFKINNLETICLTAMGIGKNEYKGLLQKYTTLLPTVLQTITDRIQQIWLHSDILYSLSKLKKDHEKVSAQILDLSNSILQKKKNEINIAKKTCDQPNVGKMKPFLELMMDMTNKEKCLTDKEIREETDTIIVAGHETTASALNFTLMLMGSHPEVQEKVYNELLQVVGDSDKDIDKDDLSKLVYTEAVLKEGMRLYPLLPIVGRKINKDIKIKNYILKANSICILSTYGLNRHPIWGSDADQFRPERWLDTATLPDMNCFGTFGLGRRVCIGKVYAMMSMKITVAHVLRKYRVYADMSNLVLKWQLLTYPVSGHQYTFELRDV